ncbi:MAG: hypothetical protein JOZ39_04690 [Chloroflexi bacterium]|nr:hypothetical protein [Chloroflexota bacterium]
MLSFVLLGRRAWRWPVLALQLFILIQLPIAVAFGDHQYGIRIVLLTYLFLPLFAGAMMSSALAWLPRMRPTLMPVALLLAAVPIVVDSVLPRLPERRPFDPVLTEINDDIELDGASYAREVHPGDVLHLALIWGVLKDPHAAYGVSIHGILDRPNRTLFVADSGVSGLDPLTSPWDNLTPTANWRAGDRIVDRHLISIPSDVPTGVYRIEVGLYSSRPDLTPEPGKAELPLRIVAPAAATPPAVAPAGDWGVAKLTRVERDATGLRLTWQAAGPLPADYTVFVHALDANGQVVAQHDSQPASGAWPTSAWQAGQTIVDQHDLDIPAVAVTLEVGLYELASGRRLELAGGGDNLRLSLSSIAAASG